MSPKARNIIGWILTAALTFLLVASAIAKLAGGADIVKAAANFGLPRDTFKIIGIVEIISVLLFIIPRTGMLGTLLLAAYIGGAIATHLEHQQPIVMPILVECVIWITAAIRFPELSQRIMGRA